MVATQPKACVAGQTAISVQGSFAWQEDGEASLEDIDLDIPAGSLVAVVGATGASLSIRCSAVDCMVEQSHQQLSGSTATAHVLHSLAGSTYASSYCDTFAAAFSQRTARHLVTL